MNSKIYEEGEQTALGAGKQLANVAVELTAVGPASMEVWRELMQRDPEAIPYQSPEWVEAACATGAYENASRLYRASDGARFVLPLLQRRGLPRALTTIASMPQGWGMGGLVGDSAATPQLARAVLAELEQAGYLGIHLRPNPRQAAIWAEAMPARAVAVPRRAHVIDLTGGYDHIWETVVSAKLRSNVRRAARLVEVEFDSTGRLMPIFCELLRASRRRWTRNDPLLLAKAREWLAEPMSKFDTIARVLGEHCRVGVAYVGGKPAAASVVLRRGNVNDARSAMDIDVVGSTGANDLLQKLAIDDAVRHGCRYFHMGESGQSVSLSRFKEKFGAEPYDYAEFWLQKFPAKRLDLSARAAVKRLIGRKR